MTKKVFISHSSKDARYAAVFVDLLKKSGFYEKEIFCSSRPETGVQTGELIFTELKKALTDKPLVLYLLSDNYYESVFCLNEMGASWITTEEHLPVLLPGFSPDKIKGVLDSNRLSFPLTTQTTNEDIFAFLKRACDAFDKQIGDYHHSPKEVLEADGEKLRQLIRWEDRLTPNEDGEFETVLGEERKIKEDYFCFLLDKPIAEEFLQPSKVSPKKPHFLVFPKSWGNFETGDRVRFQLKEKEPFFKNMRDCADVYLSQIKKSEA